MKQKAVIYTRVSTGAQAEDGTGLEVQEASCLRKAEELCVEVIDIVSDEGVSGAFYLSRPGIQKALKMLEAGEANVLITMKLDRSGRDADTLGLIRKRVVKANAKLVFADGANFENNATGNLMFRVSAGFAEYEKEVIRERTMSGRRRRAEQGQQPSRTQSPFGYSITTKENVMRGEQSQEMIGTYQIVPEQAEIVRELFSRFAGGASLNALARWLKELNVSTQRGGKVWYASTIRYLLANPVYQGKPVFGRNQWRTDESRMERGFKPSYSSAAPKSEWVTLQCEPLVSVEIWDACQARMRENQGILSGRHEHKYLLAGLLRCPVCDRCMTAENDRNKRLYYRCKYSRASRSITGEVCTKTTYKGEQVESLILRNLHEVSHKPELFATALRTFARKMQETNGPMDELARLRKELKALDAQEETTAKAQIDAMAKGRSGDVYDRLLDELDSKREAVRSRLGVLEAKAIATTPLNALADAERVAEVLRRVDEVLSSHEVDTAKKQAILSGIIKAIRPEDDGYSIELRSSPGTSQGLSTVQMISIHCDPGASR